MSASTLPPQALALQNQLYDAVASLVHKKNAVLLAPTDDHQKRLCNELIQEIVSLCIVLRFLIFNPGLGGTFGLIVKGRDELPP